MRQSRKLKTFWNGFSHNKRAKRDCAGFEGLKRAIASLAEMPERCPLARENKEFSFEVRNLLYGRKPHVYRVVFTVEGDTVYILHIWHGRRRRIT
ncbi:MAG TPA: type II toxin-antitoxin system RelE/ParE family toxin [Terriglobales bacterium]|nr:type II toxin-antitoxin system RelE/ParE family toxin [Terriglobales bacterium]